MAELPSLAKGEEMPGSWKNASWPQSTAGKHVEEIQKVGHRNNFIKDHA